MYKCTECGNEYETKPDYCDCGNDSFTVIKETPKPEQTKTDAKPRQEIKVVKPKIQETAKPKTKHISDPISPIIFTFCVILSLIIIFFIGNPKDKPQTKTTTPKAAENIQNIPSLDSFWNNSTEGIVSDNTQTSAPEPQPQPQKPIIQKQIIYVHDAPAPAIKQTAQPKQTIKPAAPKQQTSNIQKQTPVKASVPAQTQQKTSQPKTQQPQTNSSLSALTNRIQQNITYNQQTKPTAPITQQTPTSNSVTAQNRQTPATPTKQTVSAPQPSTVSQKNSVAAKQELSNYKIALRNTIGRKIDFTKVVGDGNCTVSFKIASNGKLTNRAFTKQSSNITLNDAVYAAMMATPSFNTPPSAYNNETLTLYVKFYNGNFTINLN